MLTSFFSGSFDALSYFKELLLRLPAILLAISLHESAHGWVAEKCGDPTARLMGRITINPIKHFDLTGMLCMFIIGLGWAKPVPVNPNNFKNYRRDDLKVSLAGITMNLILALLSFIAVYVFFTFGFTSLISEHRVAGTYLEWYQAAPWNSQIIAAVYGDIPGYLFEMLSYMITINVCLAVFNLIPAPPLDGYHIINDIFFKRPLFASRKAASIGQGVLFVLLFTGLLSTALNFVLNACVTGFGTLFYHIVAALGIL